MVPFDILKLVDLEESIASILVNHADLGCALKLPKKFVSVCHFHSCWGQHEEVLEKGVEVVEMEEKEEVEKLKKMKGSYKTL
ncbi:hypothetical protein VNO78_27183 [Psophocarpus tetragonolobus]|uniref:Uncharacterized protein n=1 Tax=Psophocarpus tetragonolobus TaxID=3891 RepID=A0AAN9S0B8_PSOTE